MMASISLKRYVGCSWHVTQVVRIGLPVREPAPLLMISSSPGHWETSGHDTGRAIGVLLKPARTVMLSAQEAIGRAIGKPLAAIEAEKA